MQSGSDLFELIRSLTKQEKRYFRIEAQRRRGTNQYAVLFDALDAMHSYDEKLLRKKLRKEKFIHRLAAVKKYLYTFILNTQAAYYSGKTASRVLDEQLQHISVLYRKALYAQCRKLIGKAKLLAKRHELFTRWLDILELEKNIHALLRFSSTTADEMNAILEEEKLVLHKIANTKKYYNKNARMVMLLHQRGFRLQEQDKTEVNNIMNEDLQDVERAETFDARLYYYNTNTAFGQASGNLQHSYDAAKGYIEFLESYPERLRENANRFVVGLSNFMVICSYLKGKQQDIRNTIQRLAGFENHPLFKAEDIQLKIFLARYSNESILSIRTCNYASAQQLEAGIERGLLRFGAGINKNEHLMLCYYLAYLFFGHEDYSSALKWNNKILHHFEPNVREDIQCYSRFLNLLIHYEKGNVDLLEYELKSTYRFLSRRQRIFRFETVMMNFIRKNLSQPLSRKETIYLFGQLRDELVEVFKDPQEKTVEEYFDFVSWLESKIKGRKFSEIKTEKLQAENSD